MRTTRRGRRARCLPAQPSNRELFLRPCSRACSSTVQSGLLCSVAARGEGETCSVVTVAGRCAGGLFWSLLFIAVMQCQAFMPPTRAPLPDFDKRSEPRASSTPSSVQSAAVEHLRLRLPHLQVDFDSVSGSPKTVSNGEGFLTGPLAGKDGLQATRAFLREHKQLFGHGPEALDKATITRDFVTPHNGLKTTVWQQQVNGVPVFEAILTSHTTKDGELVNISSQFLADADVAAANGVPNRAGQLAAPNISARQAVAIAGRSVGEQIQERDVVEDLGTNSVAGLPAVLASPKRQQFKAAALKGDADARLAWLPLAKDRLSLCWDVVLTSGTRSEMFRVLVDVQTGEPLLRRCLTAYLSDATYRVYTSDSPSPFSPGNPTPSSTQPPLVSRALVTLSALNTNASPNGWIDDGGNETRGNNVDAHTDLNNDNQPDLPRPHGAPTRVFDFPLDLTQSPDNYRNAAVVQLFYWNNFMHDKLYELGFTESAGNFQNNNFGRGGAGNDAVQADAQDGGGVNNANFSTPPDGSPGRMQMYVFTGPTPDRDGDFDAEVILHEYTHGLSNRRVGGGVGISALQPAGMGEGWSDFYGLALLSEPGDDVNGVYAAGAYASYLLGNLNQNYYFGIRRYPYCTDLAKNPLTFKDIDPSQASTHSSIPRSPIIGNSASEVHNMGEVWCVTLWEARANLINKYGWGVGNQLVLQLVTDGMNLSPPNPNFLQARNAILQADQADNNGANRADLWAAFAKRGMGYSATSPSSSTSTGVHEAFDVPDPLQIIPASLAVSGPLGGPFAPNPTSFTVTNNGSNTLTWSLSNTSTWLTVSPPGGTLASGGSATVSAVLNDSATNFPGGAFTAQIRFTNVTSGVVQSATYALSVVGRNMFDNFDPGIHLSQWSSFGGTVGSTVIATNYGGNVSPPNSLWFGDSGSRFATTVPINTTSGGFISFYIRLANGGGWPWELVDDLPAEGVVLEASTNSGFTWTAIGQYSTPAYYNWTSIILPIPAAAQAPVTLFRWRQLIHSGSQFDHWALDNVDIEAGPLAPTIMTQPQSQNAFVGDRVEFDVTAFGSQPLSYQWMLGGTNISGATTSSLVLTNVQFSDAGSYSVFLSNSVDVVTSSNAVLAVYPPPPCTSPPAGLISWWKGSGNALDQFGSNNGTLSNGVTFLQGKVGQTFSFDGLGGTVLVPDSSSLRLDDQFTIEAWINTRSTFGDHTIIGKVGGSPGDNGYELVLAGTTLLGQFNSPGQTWPGYTIVYASPIVIGTWNHVAWTYDQSAMKLYWNGVPVETNVIGPRIIFTGNNNLHISGNDGNHVYFDGLIDEPSIYRRALSDTEIAAIYNSSISGKCVIPVGPAILAQPQSQTVVVGGNTTFSVTASGSPPLSYQWQLDGTNIPAATSTPLTLSNVQFSQAGYYSVIVSNSINSIMSSNALLTVIPAPPCAPLASGLVSWWQAESNASDAIGGNSGTIAGGTTFSAGRVNQAFNFNGTDGTIIVPDSPSLRFSNKFTIEAWINTRSTLGDHTIVGKVGGTPGDNGYELVLSGTTLIGQFNSPGQGWPGYKVTYGAPVSMGVWAHVAWTYDQSAMKLYWNGVLVATSAIGSHAIFTGNNNLHISGNDGNHVYFDGLIDETSVYDRALSDSEVATIFNAGNGGKCITPAAPTITTQPSDQTVTAGGNASFSVFASGTPPLMYQWLFKGGNLSGATASSLVLNNVQPTNAGEYSVIVSNNYGWAPSSNAVLTVNPAGTCSPLGAGLISWWPGESNVTDVAGGNSGTLQGGATFAGGNIGRAFSFNGLSGSISVPDSTSLRLSNQFTIEAWINTSTTSGDQGIVSKVGGIAGDNGYQLVLSGNLLTGQFNTPGQSWPGYRITYAAPVGIGTWNHVAWTYDQSSTRLYWNGVSVASATIGFQTLFAGPSSLRISGDDNNHTYFNGLIDEPSVYSRALSDSEIAAIYNAGSAGKCGLPPAVLVQPQNQTALAGSAATFNVTARGSTPLFYQWQFNGTNLSGASAPSLVLTNVQRGHAGAYSVLVSNAISSVSSSNALLTVISTQSCTPAPSGLVSWWQAQGNASDALGTNAGTLLGGATFVSGQVGQAFSFNGANGTVLVPDSGSLRFSNQFTIEAWINARSTTGDHSIISKVGGAVGDNGYELVLSGTTVLGQFNSPGQGWPGYQITYSSPITTSTWNHVAWTYDQSSMRLYWNGVQVAIIGIGAHPVFTGANNLHISGNDGNHVFFDGLIDEPSVYNRALTASEVSNIYLAGSVGKCGFAPKVLSQPQSVSAVAGSPAIFSVTANGSFPLAYQWQFGGADLPGATSNSLALANIQFNQAGTYSVILSNAIGSVHSSNATLTITSPPTCDPPPSGLVGWWAAEGSPSDLTGTNDGTISGGTTFTSGKAGQGFNFNGIDGTVIVPDSPSLRLSNQFTIEAWINARSLTGDHTVLSKVGGSAGDNGYEMVLSGTTLVGQFNSPGQGWPGYQITYFSPIATGTWNHVAWTYDQSAMRLFWNGVLVASNLIGPHPIFTGNNKLHISGNDGNHVYFAGLIDEPSVYSRALSSSEIADIYNAGTSGKCGRPFAPLLTSEPQSQTVGAGDPVTFSTTASGTAPLYYQWRFNGSTLLGATSSNLVLSNAQPTNAGAYSVFITNSYGTATSSNAILTVIPVASCAPPASGLISWWQAQGNAHDVTGTNNGTIRGTVGFAPGEVDKAFSFDGASGSVLVPDSSSLRLSNKFTIEAWINARSANADRSIVGKVGGAAGDNGYQFVLSGKTLVGQFNSPGQGWPGYAITYASPLTTGTWNHVAWTYDQSTMKLYWNGMSVATNPIGAHPIFTGGSNLRISGDDNNHSYFDGLIDEPSIYNRALSASEISSIYQAGAFGKCGRAPGVLIQPQNLTAAGSSSPTLSVTASGTSLAYQWRFNGEELPGATSSSLTLPNVQFNQAGTYSVVLSNSLGSLVSSDAVMSVISPAACAPLASGLVGWWAAEGSANDSAGSNNGSVSGGTSFAPGEAGQTFSFNGVDGSVIVPDSPSLRLTTQLTIEAWINNQSMNSDMGIVSKVGGIAGDNGYQFVLSGTTLVGQFNSPGQGWPGYQVTYSAPFGLGVWNHVAWTYDQSAMKLYWNGVPVATNVIGAHSIFAGTNRLRISGDENNKTYFDGLIDEASVYNRALSESEIAAIYNVGSSGKCGRPTAPLLASEPQSQTVSAGDTATFSAAASGSIPLRYQWQLNGSSLLGATSSSLVLSNVQPSSGGVYSVLITNLYGVAASSNALLTVVVTTPAIQDQPQSRTNIIGTVATFVVSATGSPVLGYHWKKGGTNLTDGGNVTGATTATLTLSNVQTNDAGDYSVGVTNSVGGLISSAATLTVVEGAAITAQPAGQSVTNGCNVFFNVVATGTEPKNYQWWKDELALPGKTNATLALSNVQDSDFGAYFVVVINPYGSAISSNAVLSLNHSPVAGPVTARRFAGGGLKIKSADLLSHASDLDGDSLVIVGVSSNSTAGGTVILKGNWAYYTPPPGFTNTDTFDFTVSDGHCGGNATGTATVEVKANDQQFANFTIQNLGDGFYLLHFAGIPGWTYRVQYTENLDSPNWVDLATITADQFGEYEYVDHPPAGSPARYYRSIYP